MLSVPKRLLLVHGALLALVVAAYAQWVAAECGFFSRLGAWVVLVALIGVGATLAWHLAAQLAQAIGACSYRAGRLGLLLVALLLGGAAYGHFFAIPSERITANNDQGTYALQAVTLARTGSLVLHAPALAETDASFHSLLLIQRPSQAQRDADIPHLRDYYLGFFVKDRSTGELESQFPTAYPVFLACGYATLGWSGLQHVNLACLGVAVLIATILALQWWGVLSALTVFSGFLFFPLHVWIGNTFFAEPSLMLLWLIAILVMAQKAEADEAVARLCTASVVVALALALAVKIDALPATALLAVLAWENIRRPWDNRRGFIAIVGGLMVAVPLYFLLRKQTAYVSETLSSLLNSGKLLLSDGVMLGCAGVLFLALGLLVWKAKKKAEGNGQPNRNSARIPWLQRPADWWRKKPPVIRWLIAIGLLGVLGYMYFVRPRWTGTDQFYYWPHQAVIKSYREATLLRLAWYFSPVVLWTALAGCLLLVIKGRGRAQFWLLLLGLGSLLLFSYDLRNNPLQPYAMRRFLTFASPLLIFGLGVIVAQIARVAKVGVALALVAIALISAALIRIDLRLNTTSDSVGLIGQLQTLANAMPPDAIVITYGDTSLDELAAPLQFVHGRTMVSLSAAAFLPANAGSLRRQLAIWQKTGRSIWALTPPGYRPLRAIFQDIPASRKNGVIVVTRIAESTDHEPFEKGQRHWQYYLRQVKVPNGDSGSITPSKF